MKGNAAVLLLAIAVAASAQGIQKWRTKDGKIVYGNAPPAGAVPLEEYEADARANRPMPTAEPAAVPEAREREREKAVAPPAEKEESIVERRKRERAERRAREQRSRERRKLPEKLVESEVVTVTQTKTVSDGYNQIVTGRVANGWHEPIYQVQVCGGGSCWRVRPTTIQPGGTGEFAFDLRGGAVIGLVPVFTVGP